MLDKAVNVVLLSRLPIHGATLCKRIKQNHQVIWANKRLPYKLTLANMPFLLLYEFLSVFATQKKLNNRPTVTLVHFISFDALIAVLIKKICGYPVVLYAIGSDVLGVTNSIQRIFLTWVISKVDVVLCVNSNISSRIRNMGQEHVVILPTPFVGSVSVNRSESRQYDLITIGALESFKQQNLLIEACSHLTFDAKIALVGDGSCRDDLEKLAKQSLNQNYTFLGQIPHLQVWQALCESKVYVHTSLREGLPSAILEAIWSNLPVIAVSSSYVNDLTRIYRFNIVIVDRSAQSLANAIEMVVNNYSNWQAVASNNRLLLQGIASSWGTQFEKVLVEVTKRE